MIYLAAGLVCLSIGLAYGIGLYRGYTYGYKDAIDEVTIVIESLQEKLLKNKTDEE